MALAIACPATSSALTYEALPLSRQAQTSDAVFEAVVDEVVFDLVDGTFPVMRVSATVATSMRGATSGSRVDLLFPGGFIGEVFVSYGVPRPTRGDRLVMFASEVPGALALRNGPSSLALLRDGMAVDAAGNPIVEMGCEQTSIIARPLAEQPATLATNEAAQNDVAHPPVHSSAGPPDRVFLADPTEHGLPWSAAVETVAACVANHGAEVAL